MKTNLLIIIFLSLGCLLMGTGCSGEEAGTPVNPDGPDTPEQPGVTEPGLIQLAGGDTSLSGSLTLTSFPNNGEIGIIAAEYQPDEYGQSDPDWTTYTDIQDAIAITTGTSENGRYGFTWQTTKYWPMDDRELVFAAYSPSVRNTGCMEFYGDHRAIQLTLREDMPDVLYADKNGVPHNYSKNGNTTVDLGAFEHALCQLKVSVRAHEEMNTETIRLEAIRLVSYIGTASLNLCQQEEDDDGEEASDSYNPVTLGAADSEVEITLLKEAAVDFSRNPYSSGEILVFPYSQDQMDLWITLDDGGFDVEHKINMSMFNVPFERGKLVHLIINVKSQQIVDPDAPEDNEILLYGTVGPWKEKGNSTIVIQ